MPFLNFNNYPSSLSNVLSTYTKDRNNVYYANKSGLYKYNFTEKTDSLIVALSKIKIAFFEDDYFYCCMYSTDALYDRLEISIKKYSLDGSLVVSSGTFTISSQYDGYAKLLVDKYNKKIVIFTLTYDIRNRSKYYYKILDYSNFTLSESWVEFSSSYYPTRSVIYSIDGTKAYDTTSDGIVEFDIYQLSETASTIVKRILTTEIINTSGTLKRIENKLYILGGEYGNSGKIFNLDESTIENVDLYYSFTTVDTDFNIAGETISIHSSSSPYNLIQFDIVIYSNQYNIYNNSGIVEYASYRGQAPIVSLKFERKDNNIIEYTIRTEERDITGSYTAQVPSNLTLLGYSSIPNSTSVQYPLDREINISIRNSKDFYEVYGMDIPVVSVFDVYLYKNSAEPHRVDKSLHLSTIGVVSGTFRDETSITDMVINFEYAGVVDFNYVYIPIFNRYYFVNDVTSIRNNLWSVSLSVDVLMTYKDAIINCKGFVDRNEHASRPMLVDKKRVVSSGKTISYTAIPNELFTETNGWYVLNGLALSTHGGDE